ncbi:MAG: hypothetical protein H7A38_02325 [Chlamydiales bacterium]|nr:hypothetical protein [Chlamydiales bacterium]
MVRALLIFLCSTAFAAGPMTHLYLGEEYCLKRRYDEKETGEFLVGTLFPDIRYITHFPREKTHFPVDSLLEIWECPSPFLAGMKFHNWVDGVREAFVVRSGIYEKVIPYANGKEATLLKFIEEEILDYDGRKWGALFREAHEEEKKYTTDAMINKWHWIVWGSMQARPNWPLWGLSYLKAEAFGITSQTLYDWSYLLPTFANDPAFQGYVDDLLSHLFQKMEEVLPK